MKPLIVTLLLCVISCATTRPTVLPDPLRAHKLSRPAEIYIWAKGSDGILHEVKAWFPSGSVIANEAALAPPKEK